jgi:glycerate-2-kinase
MSTLVNNGDSSVNKRARKLALKGLEAALNAVDPKRIIRAKLELKNSVLTVDGQSFDLRKFKHVYVVGGGKAGGMMAEALEEVLDKRITSGLVNVPHGSKGNTRIIELHGANHPVPDEAGVEGTRRMLKIAEEAEKGDLLICVISGGGSSLMPFPRGGISIGDKRALTDALLKCGASINEINTVRKHISDFKGGWLAKRAYPATILNLILSDVVGDPLDFIASGPTVPDSTTFSDATTVLKKYKLWGRVSASVRKVLSDGEKGLIPETPKKGDEAFGKVHNVVIANCRSACLAACDFLKASGLNTLLLTATVEGEAKHVGTMMATMAREIVASGNPVAKPAAMIVGGETTVTVMGKGKGGRNQELALAAALRLKGLGGVVVASLSTDGVDGPTDAAGAVADAETISRGQKAGLDAHGFLENNDSYRFFARLDDLIFTGATGTNVNDLSLAVVL